MEIGPSILDQEDEKLVKLVAKGDKMSPPAPAKGGKPSAGKPPAPKAKKASKPRKVSTPAPAPAGVAKADVDAFEAKASLEHTSPSEPASLTHTPAIPEPAGQETEVSPTMSRAGVDPSQATIEMLQKELARVNERLDRVTASNRTSAQMYYAPHIHSGIIFD